MTSYAAFGDPCVLLGNKFSLNPKYFAIRKFGLSSYHCTSVRLFKHRIYGICGQHNAREINYKRAKSS